MRSNALRIIGGAAAGALLILPLAALATRGDTCAAQAGIAGGDKASTTAQFQALGACQISYRNADLNAAVQRVGQMQKVATTTKDSLTQTLNASLASLGALHAKLNGDTDAATAKGDYRAIFISNRIYALVLPRTWVIATSDRVQAITAQLQDVNAKLAALNANASTSVQVLNAVLFADLNIKLADAPTQATNAMNAVLPLVPDQGVQSVKDSNKAAITGAEAMEKVAKADLVAAIADIKQIRTNLGQ